jgi:hypothetical protein
LNDKLKVFVSFFFMFASNSIALSQEVPPFANIVSIDYRGSGCDANSATAAITSDLSYISVLYDRFTAEIGQGSEKPNAKAAEKNCVVVVKMQIPSGWSFQFDEAEYHGFVAVPNQMTMAYQLISIETPSGRGRQFDQHIMKGPKMENFVTVYRKPVQEFTQENWSRPLFGNTPPRQGLRPPHFPGGPHHPGGPQQPRRPRKPRKDDLFECSDKPQNAVLRIRSRIGVRNMLADKTNPLVKIVIDSTDASFQQKLKINWNKCRED